MPYLQIMTGARKGEKFGVTKDVSIGRSAENTIQIDDPATSGKHCLITIQGTDYVLVDNNSTNGTYLNGARVSGSEFLNAKDIIKIGDVEIMLDGQDLKRETVATTSSAPNTRISVRPGAGPSATVFAKKSGFGNKRDNTKLWWALGITAIIILLGGVAWFLFTVMKT